MSRLRRLWAFSIPVLAVAAIAGAYRFLSIPGAVDGVMASVLNAFTQAVVIWRYVGLLVWPFGQSIMHSVHRVTSLADPLAWVAFGALVLVCALAFVSAVHIRSSRWGSSGFWLSWRHPRVSFRFAKGWPNIVCTSQAGACS